MKMLRRRQSLRHLLVGTSFRNQAVGPSTQPQKLTKYKKELNKKRMHSFRYPRKDGKDHKKKKTILQRCLKTIEKRWNAPSCKFDADGNCTITTPDGRFELSVCEPTPSGNLSISTCVYTCTSDVQSPAVVRKATEMNTFLGAMGDQDYKYALKIDQSSPSINEDDTKLTSSPQMKSSYPLPITIALSLSCSMNSFFNAKYKLKSHEDGDQDEKLLAIVQEFAETALNFQTKLESVDEGRLGMAPRLEIPTDSVAIHTPHIELLANPPSIVTQFMNQPVNSIMYLAATSGTTPKSPASVNPASSSHMCPRPATRGRSVAQELRSQSTQQLQRAMTKAHSSKSARHILSQFSSPEEARVFDLYTRQKSKRRATRKHNRIERYRCRGADRTVATDVSEDSLSIANSSKAPKRTVSLPIAIGNRNCTRIPKPPALIDWNKTPIISNKGISPVPRENNGINEMTASKKLKDHLL